MANRVRGLILSSWCRYSATAQAMLRPSKVLVPRPTSSSRIRLRSVALFKILAVSTISTMKVDCPAVRKSMAPTLVKIRSTTPILAARAGTNEPIWASRQIRATCLR